MTKPIGLMPENMEVNIAIAGKLPDPAKADGESRYNLSYRTPLLSLSFFRS